MKKNDPLAMNAEEMPLEVFTAVFEKQEGFTDTIDLDAIYPDAINGSFVVITVEGSTYLFQIQAATEAARAGFGLSAKTSRLTLAPSDLTAFKDMVRQTVVHLRGPEMELAAIPLTGPVQGHSVELDRTVEGLTPGRRVIFTGKRARAVVSADPPGLQMTRPDGTTVQLLPGESVQMTGPTKLNDNGKYTWQVRDAGGQEGTATGDASALRWTPAPDSDEPVAEVGKLKAIDLVDGVTTALELDDDLVNCFDRGSLAINANAIHGTHGETKTEVLGSGDASQAFQKFNLKQAPLTYVSSSEASGETTTLEVRVDDVAWREVPTLYGQGPHDQVYIVRMAADGKVSVEFGDGVTGARIPTGVENVKATFRAGTGVAGMVGADRIKLLMTRPLGVQTVDNPVKAGVAADPEGLDSARENAPQQVVTFERVVSITDFEDYARAFAGVVKAQADWLWDGESRKVVVTVAGTNGASIEPKTDIHDKLVDSISSHADPHQRFEVQSFDRRWFALSASVFLEPGRDGSTVTAAATEAVNKAFSFERRSLGQPVFGSDVIAVLQSTPGVLAVDLTVFRDRADHAATKPAVALPALRARFDHGEIKAAQLLTISDVAQDVVLTVAT